MHIWKKKKTYNQWRIYQLFAISFSRPTVLQSRIGLNIFWIWPDPDPRPQHYEILLVRSRSPSELTFLFAETGAKIFIPVRIFKIDPVPPPKIGSGVPECCLKITYIAYGYTKLEVPAGTWATVRTWMGDHSSVEVEAVATNTVKSQERRNGASKTNGTKSWGKKKKKYLNVSRWMPTTEPWPQTGFSWGPRPASVTYSRQNKQKTVYTVYIVQ